MPRLADHTMLLAAMFLLIGCGGGPDVERIVVFGVDGATWDVMDPLLAEGRLPNFERLIATGVRGTVRAEEPLKSPVIWTTIATGRRPEAHGIDDFLRDGVPVGSNLRQVPAIWNIVSDSDTDRSVGVTGWYVTWPAEAVRGFNVADRLLLWKLENRLYPAELEELLPTGRPWNPHDPKEAYRLERFVGAPVQPSFEKTLSPDADPEVMRSFLLGRRLAKPYMRDTAFANLAVQLQRGWQPDLHLAYLIGVDYTSHGFWQYSFPEQFPGPPPEDAELLGSIIPTYYEYMDEVLGRMMNAAGPDATFIVLADHGFGPSLGEYAMEPEYWYLTGSHRPDGIVILAGPPFVPGARLEDPDHLDVVPTLLTLLDLPVGTEMPGRVWTEAMSSRWLRRHPTRTTERYDADWTWSAAPMTSPDDAEIMDGLRALGYIPPADQGLGG